MVNSGCLVYLQNAKFDFYVVVKVLGCASVFIISLLFGLGASSWSFVHVIN